MKKQAFYLLGLVACMACSNQTQETTTPREVKVEVRKSSSEMDASSIANASAYAATIEEAIGTDLSFSVMGTVEKVLVVQGQRVAAGDVLATLDQESMRNNLAMSEAATKQAEELLKQAQDAYDRSKKLHDSKAMSDLDWVNVETKLAQAQAMLQSAQAQEKNVRKTMQDTKLTAPFAGYIASKNMEVGQNVMAGVTVAKLVNIDKVNVKISVPEKELGEISVGQIVAVKVGSLGSKLFSAKVTEKGVSGDALSHTYVVRAELANVDRQLLPGMICEVYVTDEAASNTVTVPANVVQIDYENKTFVWTVVDGKAHKTYILTGRNVGENVVVLKGLTADDEVIIKGQQKVSEGTIVRI